MTSTTTYEEALEVLQKLTALHGSEPYFKKAEIVLSDGFHGVDIRVDTEKWQMYRPPGPDCPRRINRVPVCYILEG
jgi:hypothetical protein